MCKYTKCNLSNMEWVMNFLLQEHYEKSQTHIHLLNRVMNNTVVNEQLKLNEFSSPPVPTSAPAPSIR